MKSQPISLVVKGSTPSLLDTVKANEIIGVINALATMKVVPDGKATFRLTGDTAVLDFGGSNGTDDSRIGKVEVALRSLIDSLAAGNIDASCDPNDSTITVSLNFPNFPNSNF